MSDAVRPSRVTVSETTAFPVAGKVSVGVADVVLLKEPAEVDHAYVIVPVAEPVTFAPS